MLLLPLLVLAVAAGPDSALAGAREALARGRPWQASRLVAPVLADAARRSPDAVLLAATAASRWGGWAEVRRLLVQEPWLDSLSDGQGRRLLARAALEQRDDSLAWTSALAALRTAPDTSSGELLVLLARALDRLDARDSAAGVYERAADRLPLIGDWLRLRAAAVTDDSARRAALFARIGDSLVRSRAVWTEAAARERAGDLAGAAGRYAALGARLKALRLRLAPSPDPASRAAVRGELLALIADRKGTSDVREAIALLDSAFAPLTPAEELIVAHSAEASGLAAQAVRGYARALAAGRGTSQDRFGYASALARLGRYGDAAFQFNLVRRPRTLAALAAYHRARAMVRDGQASEGLSALRDVVRDYPRDTVAAASALFLLADLATDQRADAEARTLFRRLATRYPSSRFAPTARFRAALIAFTAGRPSEAAAEFDALAQRSSAAGAEFHAPARRWPRAAGASNRQARRDSTTAEAAAATYWAGRAWAAAGDSTAARARWEVLAEGDPVSYYASLSRRRLGREPWAPAPMADSFPSIPSVDSGVARAELLARLGLAPESRLEYDRLVRGGDDAVDRLLAVAHALRGQGRAFQSIQVARRAMARGAPADARLYRLLYPVIHADALRDEAAAQGLDPSFVAALVRQESMFNPSATSPVGARGLMQLMPEVGARVAQSLGYPAWDPVLLYQADVSLQLGVRHLRELAGRYDEAVHVLAAYNAGASRVERWRQKRGAEDPEVFAERIPFDETRDYVRAIQRNQELYRALYGWPAAPGRPSDARAPEAAG